MSVSMRLLRSVLIAACLVPVSARADDFGGSIDLTAFDELPAGTAAADLPLREVGLRSDDLDGSSRRLYVTAMLGPSFASLSVTDGIDRITTHDAPLAAGGAVGVAFERANGRLRIEAEGMGRDSYFGPVPSLVPANVLILAASNWSVMGNVWRDVMLTERLGLYGGGGIGAGGYRIGVDFSSPAISVRSYDQAKSSFAWQAGGGVIFEITERLTFDVGYRYFQINSVSFPAVPASPFSGLSTEFASSELMFGLRLYEPFQRWWR